MDPALGKDLAKLEGVSDLDGIRLMHHEFMGLQIFVLALDPGIYFKRSHPIYLEGGKADADEMSSHHDRVMISENLSNRRNIHRGDVIEVDTPTGRHRYTVSGVIIDYTSDQGLIAMNHTQFTADFHDDKVDTFELYVDNKSLRDDLRKQITDRWGKQYNLYVLTNDQLREESQTLIDQSFQVSYATEFVAVVLALLGIINTLLAAVIDRTREIGLLRAVGASRGQVIRSIAGEAACMGVVGGLLGVSAGLLVCEVLIHSVGAQGTGWNIPLVFPWMTCVQMGFTSLLAAIGAGLYPARRAAGLDVVEALAYE
jgi:putative ABC transport system permease protein